MTTNDYWIECISVAAEECGLSLSAYQLKIMAQAAKEGHEYYGMAFYSPPATDRISAIEEEYRAKICKLQSEFEEYQRNAEKAVKIALRQYSDAHISIGEHGEVLRHEGDTVKIQ